MIKNYSISERQLSTLSHSGGDSFSCPMLIIAEVTGSLVMRLGLLAWLSAQWDLNQTPFDSYHNALSHQTTLHNKVHKSLESLLHCIYRGIAEQFKNIFVELGLRLKLLSDPSIEFTRRVLVKLLSSILLASVVRVSNPNVFFTKLLQPHDGYIEIDMEAAGHDPYWK